MISVERMVEDQLVAFGVDEFEIGLIRTQSDGAKQCKRYQVTSAQIVDSVRWLKKCNAAGWNINITPAAPHSFVMLDDLSADAIAAMHRLGFGPCLVIRTSANNYQAWVRYEEVFTPEIGTAAAKDLAFLFGADYGAAAHLHFSKLAGFTNRKESRRNPETGFYPYVALMEATGQVCSAGREHCAYLLSMMPKQTMRPQAKPVQMKRELLSFDSFQERNATRYGNDQHRIDFAYAVYCIHNDVSDALIEQDLMSRPEIEKKGPLSSQKMYVRHTVTNAHRKIGYQ